MTRPASSSTRLLAGTAAAFIGAAAMIGWGITTLRPAIPAPTDAANVDLWSTGSSSPVALATLSVPPGPDFANNNR